MYPHAEANQLTVFTHDLDFGALPASRKTKGPSVVQIRTQDVLPSAAGPIILIALQSAGMHLETGALVTIGLHRHRVRLLLV